jgi:hypothetical protein
VKVDASTALGQLPVGLRAELLNEFGKITQNYRERRWEAQNLDGGKLCEVAYTILDGYTSGGNYAANASKPRNFEAACKALENRTSYPDSARMTIPRVLFALYEVRNRRGVGHVGGDVDANHMDAEFVLAAAKWVVAELIRLFHSIDVQTATEVVDSLVDRTMPVIWEVGGVKRVLDTTLSLKDQTLLLLYADPSPISEKDLAKYLEQDRPGNYRRVLMELHSSRWVEWDYRATSMVTLSPRGRKEVEDRILMIRNLGY